MKSQRILVTGSNGYVGGALLSQPPASDVSFLGIDKTIEKKNEQLCLDLSDREGVFNVIQEFSPDMIVHAGTHSAIAHKKYPLRSFREDVTALLNLLDVLTDRPTCRLVFFSSSYVYSGLNISMPVDETTTLRPIHDFGQAKSCYEQLILRNHHNTVIFRLSSIFGSGRALFPNTIYQMVRECLDTRRVTVWGTGTRRMQYIYMDDVLCAIKKASQLQTGIYNLGGDDYSTVADAAQNIARLAGGDVVFLSEKPEGETLPYMGNAKLKTTGISFTSLAKALPDYCKEIMSHDTSR